MWGGATKTKMWKRKLSREKVGEHFGAARVLMIISLNDDIVYFHNEHIVAVLAATEPAKRIRRLCSNCRCECVNSCKIAKLLVVPVQRYQFFLSLFSCARNDNLPAKRSHSMFSRSRLWAVVLIISTEAWNELTCEWKVEENFTLLRSLIPALSRDWADFRPETWFHSNWWNLKNAMLHVVWLLCRRSLIKQATKQTWHNNNSIKSLVFVRA